jgi:arabinogalactan endo-1,4-beta-galactosidase
MKKHILTLFSLCSYLFVTGQYTPILVNSFHLGSDLSMVKAIYDNGGTYYVDSVEKNVFEAYKLGGYDYARIRLFHSPDGWEASGTVNSLEYTLSLAELIKDAGMKLLLDFHYSDTWADPSQQDIPEAWSGLDFNTLIDSLYNYTLKVLNTFAAADVSPDMIQTGNEINNGFLWPEGKAWKESTPNYRNLSTLLKTAINAVRDSEGGNTIPIMLHAATGGSDTDTRIFIDSLIKYNVEFDVLGLSYYQCWHGTLADLEANINFLSSTYEQSVIIVETNYQSDGTSPDYCVLTEDQIPFPYSQQGQYDYMQKIYTILEKYNKAKGLFYWGGDYIYAGDIGGSYSSLFHWQGNANKALFAISDLITNTKEINPDNQSYHIQQFSDGAYKITCNNPHTKSLIQIYNLLGQKVYNQIFWGDEYYF